MREGTVGARVATSERIASQLVLHLLLEMAAGLGAGQTITLGVSATPGWVSITLRGARRPLLGTGVDVGRRLAERLGGSLAVEPDGASVRLPVPVPVPVEAPEPVVEGRRLPRILVIDDEQSLLRAYERVLRSRYNVVTASDGEEALARLDGAGFDAILCDMVMPRLSGAELFELVRVRHPGLERRFLFVCGTAVTADAEAFLESVPNPRVGKPVDRDTLLDAVHKVVEAAAG
jgi:CheY-like chemotaxis protein